jgi:hypothetical protein
MGDEDVKQFDVYLPVGLIKRVKPRRPMRGPNVVLLPTMKV